MKPTVINEKIRDKVMTALSQGQPFMLYRLPGYVPKFLQGKDKKMSAHIISWRCKYEDGITITKDYPTPGSPSFRIPDSTSKQQYIVRVGALIETLASRGKSKTVISRIISGQYDVDWISVAEKLWSAYPDSLGYFFYTPSTGAWLGATPEKLLVSCPPYHFSTQALAGTLPVETPWNVKNYEEHDIVVKYIESILNQSGASYEVNGPRDVIYGNIKHLSTGFSGMLNQEDPQEHLIRLHNLLAPTPALAGYPLGDAFDDIDDIEDHERGCYGGYISLVNQSTGAVSSYVTIRCVQFDPSTGRWAVYSGGGITPKSVAVDEWNETKAKAKKLLELIHLNAK